MELEEARSAFRLTRKFIRFGLPYRRLFAVGSVIALVIGLLATPLPLVTRYVVDRVLPSQDVSLLLQATLLLVFLNVFAAAAQFIEGLVFMVFRERTLKDIKHHLFAHVLDIGIDYHERNMSGYILSRVTSDVDRLSLVLGEATVSVILSTVTFMIALGAMLYLAPALTLWAVLLVPALIVVNWRYAGHIRSQSADVQESAAVAHAFATESLVGIGTVKFLGIESGRVSGYGHVLGQLRDTNIRFGRTLLTYQSLTFLLGSLGPRVVFFFGLRMVMLGDLSLGTYLAVSMFLSYLYSPIQGVLQLGAAFQDTLAAMERLQEILAEKAEAKSRETAHSSSIGRGEIEFERVSFSYSDQESPVLRDVSFRISPGETTAIMGISGAGKSTIVKLLCKLQEPSGGRILLDGLDIHDTPPVAIRQQIAVVPQDTTLFNGTILENIRLARPEASTRDVMDAAKTAQVDSFVGALPMGLDTVVGERGVGLSGGQRQRIALARAVLKECQVLVIDEGLSEIDEETEALIRACLSEIARKRTVLVIAHRLSTIRQVDRVVVLSDGRIVATGSPQELAAQETGRL